MFFFFFLQGIFPTQGLNLDLLHLQVHSLSLSHLGSPRACFLMNKREQINEGTAAVTKEINLSDLPPCISTMWLFMDGGGYNKVLLAPYVAQVAKRVPTDHENRRDIKGRHFRQILATCPLPGGGKEIIFSAVSTNLKMSKHYRRLNLQLSHRCSKECMEGWPFSSSPGSINNTWVQSRGHC